MDNTLLIGQMNGQLISIKEMMHDHIISSRKADDDLLDKIAKIEDSNASINFKVAKIEEDIKQMKPAIQRFCDIEHKIEGAGWLGRQLWILSTISIGAAYYLYKNASTIATWIKSLF